MEKSNEPFPFEAPQIKELCETNDSTLFDNNEIIEEHLSRSLQEFRKTKQLTLIQLTQIDQNFNREESSLGNFWSVSTKIQPYNINENDYGNPISYQNFECPHHEVTTNYFYKKLDSTVNLISYNWKPISIIQLRENNKYSGQEIDSIILNRQKDITELITNQLGKPIDIEQTSDSGREDTKWITSEGLNVYMFRFLEYPELRVYIYK